MSYNTRRTGARVGPQVNYHQAPQNVQQQRQQPNRSVQQQNPGYNTTPSSNFGQTGFSAQSGYSSVQQGKQPQQQPQQQPQLPPQVAPPAPPANPPPQSVQQQPATVPKVEVVAAPPPPAEDPVPMSEDKTETNGEGGEGGKKKPYWLKKGPAFKVSRKMRRRRQNARLRKMLTPKNALMILNELYNGIKFTTQEQINAIGQPVYTVIVDVEGKQHHGQAISKIVAKQVACENALKSLLLDKMGKVSREPPVVPMDSTQESAADESIKSDGDDNMDGSSVSSSKPRRHLPEDDVPWGCLASFALHKLFLEWQSQGIQVPIVPPTRNPLPLLKPPVVNSESTPSKPFSPFFINRRKISKNMFMFDSPLPYPDNIYEKSAVDDSVLQGASARSPLPMKKIPEDASKCNPVQLLNQLKPGSQYTEQRDGIPPNLTFTMTVVVDGQEFVGIAGNKRDAKRECARSALLKMGIINDNN